MFDHEEPANNSKGALASPHSEAGLLSGFGELEDLAYGLSRVAKVDWESHQGDICMDALADVEVLRRRLDGVAVELAAKVDASTALANAGYRNVSGYLRSELHLPKPEAGRRALLARRCRRHEAMRPVVEAMVDGRIGFAQGQLIGRYSDRDEVAWAFDEAVEAVFLPIAEAETFEFFQRAMQRWYEHHDATQGEARDRSHDARQKVKVSTSFDGMVRLDGWLPTLEGEIVSNEFERLRRQLYDIEWNEAKDKLGRAPKPDELARTADERSVAVLVLMAERSASLGDGRVTALPCVNVLVDWDTYVAASNELVGVEALFPAGGVCRTEMVLPISPRTAIETLLQGHVRRVVFDPKGQILDFGTKNRFFTGGLREAVMLRDQTCCERGCDVPARFCEVDHAQSWNDLGKTNIHNGRVLCRFHNRQKGAKSLQPSQTADGRLAFRRPSNSAFPPDVVYPGPPAGLKKRPTRLGSSPKPKPWPRRAATKTSDLPRTRTQRNQR